MSLIPKQPSEGEVKDLSSSFQATLFPLSSAEEAKALCEAYRKSHPKADHYPYAYRLSGVGKSSDDGEPGGSAGRPLLSLLESRDIDGLIVVARYFGGSKLGIPRLRRAFLLSAELAIDHATLLQEETCFVYEVEMDYSTYESLRNHAKRRSFSIEVIDFGTLVRAKIYSGARLDGLAELPGLGNLVLGEANETTILKEVNP